MRKFIWRGLAVTLAATGVCWTAAQFKVCPCARVGQLLGSIIGEKHAAPHPAESVCQGDQSPLIVHLSAPWFQDPSTLFPDANLKLEDVIRPRSRELDLIDLKVLSEAASPTRPNYAEEECEAGPGKAPASASGSTGEVGPEAPPVTLVESSAEPPRFMPPCTDDEDAVWVPMPYAEDPPFAQPSSSPVEKGFFLNKPAPATAQEGEAIHLEEPPLCQEDPAAPYHYPGCPPTSPAPGKGKPPAPAPGTPAMPRADEPPLTPDSGAGADAQPVLRPHHITFKKALPEAADHSPGHPEVDTMEFRPTDVGAEDFFHRKRIY